jgi:ABC-type sugar transport system ATPase subunit
MPRYKMVVMTRPVQGREAEYNDWYQNVHLGEMVALPGFTSAQRFRLARSLVEGAAPPYLAVYEIETDDVDAVLQELRDAAENGRLTMSDARDGDPANTFAVIYEEFGAVVYRS